MTNLASRRTGIVLVLAGAIVVGLLSTGPIALVLLAIGVGAAVIRILAAPRDIPLFLVIVTSVVGVILDGQQSAQKAGLLVLPCIALYLLVAVFQRRQVTWGSTRLMHLLVIMNLYFAWLLFSLLSNGPNVERIIYWAGGLVVSNLMVVATSRYAARPDGVRFIVDTISGLGVAMAAGALLLLVTGPISISGLRFGSYTSWTGLPRVSSFFASPIPLGMLLVFAIPALFSRAVTTSSRLVKLGLGACLVMLFLVQFLTLSKSAWIGTTVGLLVFSACWSRSALRRFVVVLVVAGLSGVVLDLLVGDLTGILSMVRGFTGLSGRDVLWQAAINLVTQHPVLGYGPGTEFTLDVAGLGLSTHSTYLRVMIEGGIVGLIFYVGAMGVGARSFVERLTLTTELSERAAVAALFSGFCGFACQQFVETTLLGGTSFYAIFLVLCLGTAVAPLEVNHGQLRKG